MNDDKDPGWFLHLALLQRTDLTPHEKLVMGVIQALERRNGCKCSNRYIAEQIGSTAGTVRKTLVGLRKRGVLMPFEGRFGTPIKGPRLATGVLPMVTGGVTNGSGGVTKWDTDTVITSNRQRESAVEDHPDWQSTLVFLTRNGYPESSVREAYEFLWAERQACKGSSAITNLSAFLRIYLDGKRRGYRSAPPAPVSQFSRTY